MLRTSILMLGITLSVLGQGREANQVRPDNPQSLAHIEKAKKLAGNDKAEIARRAD